MAQLDISKLTPAERVELAAALKASEAQSGAGVRKAVAGMPQGDLTPEQIAAAHKMTGIGGDTDELARQVALSDQLRKQVTGIQGGGVGGNIGRAAYGMASGIKDYRAQQMADALRKKLNESTAGLQNAVPQEPLMG